MTLWETQELESAAALDMWERFNEEDQNTRRLMTAGESLATAIEHLDHCSDWIAQAAEDVECIPAEDKIASYLEQIDDMLSTLRHMQENLSKGYQP